MTTSNLLKIAVPLFVAHAIEEYSTGFLGLDPLFRWVTMHGLPTVALYTAEQIALVVLLVWAIYRPMLLLRIFIGLIFILEITHIIPALAQISYYPGLVTAVLLLVLGFFYWKELIRIGARV